MLIVILKNWFDTPKYFLIPSKNDIFKKIFDQQKWAIFLIITLFNERVVRKIMWNKVIYSKLVNY